jgi:hypothetical protein
LQTLTIASNDLEMSSSPTLRPISFNCCLPMGLLVCQCSLELGFSFHHHLMLHRHRNKIFLPLSHFIKHVRCGVCGGRLQLLLRRGRWSGWRGRAQGRLVLLCHRWFDALLVATLLAFGLGSPPLVKSCAVASKHLAMDYGEIRVGCGGGSANWRQRKNSGDSCGGGREGRRWGSG